MMAILADSLLKSKMLIEDAIKVMRLNALARNVSFKDFGHAFHMCYMVDER